MKFILQKLPEEHDTIQLRMEFEELSLDEVLERFHDFLRACGYVIPYEFKNTDESVDAE